MEVEKDSTISRKEEEEDGDFLLPGFRFHPTDEELVGFYLRRRVEKRLISIELIKQVDIYKYDPWDLPKSRDTKEKEMYFFCKRGRKYKNSIRPNRVTCSGFWKATGIDKPVYNSAGSSGNQCIGLKKSLVYYRGSAGKGTKTDWMMHEFRLPATHDQRITHIKVKSDIDNNNNNNDQEAEVWTLCRILKRNATYRKSEGMIINQEVNISSNTYSMDSSSCENRQRSSYNISFGDGVASIRQNDENAQSSHGESIVNQQFMGHFSPSSLFCGDINELLRHADWEDLRSVVDYAAATDTSSFYL